MAKNIISIDNKSELEKHLTDVSQKDETTWLDRLDMSTSVNEALKSLNFNDDLAIEQFFQEECKKAVKIAFEKLKLLKVPIERPHDFLAEMVKSDHHMEKVKSQALSESKALKIVHSRKKRKSDRKFNKKVKLKSFESEVKNDESMKEVIENWKKSRSKSIKDLKNTIYKQRVERKEGKTKKHLKPKKSKKIKRQKLRRKRK